MKDDGDLRKLLKQLHSEIERTETVDEKGGELLRHLGADIRALLERTEGAQVQPHPSLAGRLEETIGHFEATHPTLSIIMSEVLATLSNAGI